MHWMGEDWRGCALEEVDGCGLKGMDGCALDSTHFVGTCKSGHFFFGFFGLAHFVDLSISHSTHSWTCAFRVRNQTGPFFLDFFFIDFRINRHVSRFSVFSHFSHFSIFRIFPYFSTFPISRFFTRFSIFHATLDSSRLYDFLVF